MYMNSVNAWDEQILLWMRDPAALGDPIGIRWFEEAVRDITALGSSVWLAVLVFATAGFLLLRGKRRLAIYLLMVSIAGKLFCDLLKILIARPRPGVVPHLTTVTTLSFPSAHAMNSAIVYLTLAAIAGTVITDRRLRAYVFGLATLIIVVVGVSRVYLGVHYPSDILAGWFLGALWAFTGWRLLGSRTRARQS
jgi:undecaprenyl-diphosphatase